MRVEVKLGVWRNEEHDYKRQIVLEDMKMFLLVKVVVVHEGGGGIVNGMETCVLQQTSKCFDLFWLGNKSWIM